MDLLSADLTSLLCLTPLLCFSTLHIVGSQTSKLPSINVLRLSCIDSTSEQLAIAAGSSYVFAEVPILAVDCNANVRHKQDWCLAYGQLMLCFAGQLCVGESLVSGHDESATTIALVWD